MHHKYIYKTINLGDNISFSPSSIISEPTVYPEVALAQDILSHIAGVLPQLSASFLSSLAKKHRQVQKLYQF
jgi:hypothetical protein